MRPIAAVLIALLLAAFAAADISGQINFTQNTSMTITGLFAYTVKYCDTDSACFSYKCFLDYDGEVDDSDTSQPAGICNLTAVTSCFHDGKWYAGGTNICNSNVTYRTCLTNETGKWSGLTTCGSGDTCSAGADAPGNCTSSSSSGGSSSGGGGGSSSGNATLSHSIAVVSGVQEFEVVQGGSASKSARFRNNGNLTLTNVTLALDIDSSWYGVNPPKFSSVNTGKEDQFNITFFIPPSAQVKSYQVNAEIKTHRSDISARFSFVMRVTPSNETVQTELLPKYSRLVAALQLVEQNITLLPPGIDEGNITEFRNKADVIKSKLEQANQSLQKGDYFGANNLLSEAESLISQLDAAMKAAKPPERPLDIVIVSLVAFVVIVILFLLYSLWPQKLRQAKKPVATAAL